jgi:tetratricopeptide (TPR) repeat protein
LQLDPLKVNANTALGVSYSRKGINDKAENKLRVALEMEPDNFYALKNLGAVLANQGKYDEAIKFFRRAIDIDPESPEVLYGLALALNENKNTEEAEKLLRKIVEKNTNEQITELARRELSKIAMDTYKSKGLRMDAVMYMVSAMKKYKSMSKDEVKRITFEIGMLGRKGLDINDPEKKYELNSMKGEFSGIELLCYMYVGFKIIDQNVNIGADLDSEYEAALNLYGRMDQ